MSRRAVGELLTGRDARDLELVADVAIVGTGAGGAVVAHNLASRGLSVAMIEAGEYLQAGDFTQREHEMLPRLFEERGNRRTSNQLITVLQGRAVGGSTVVNMGDCTPVPDSVLERWQREFAVELDAASLEPAYARVRAMLGVQPIQQREVNANNGKLLEGARLLGWRSNVFEHNRTGCIGSGYCLLGCAYDAKRSALVTYVPDAVARGATLISDATVTRIIVDHAAARGIEALWGIERRRLRVRSLHVVVAAGAIGTPLLLQASGIGSTTGLVGSHLSLQPQAAVMGFFDEEIRAFRGIPQSVFIDEFERLDASIGMGGFRIEGISSGPAMTATFVGGLGRDHREAMREYARSMSALVLVPDQPAGRVVSDRGRARIEYALLEDVAVRLRLGVRAAARAFLAAGAREVRTPLGSGLRLRSSRDLETVLDTSISPGRAALISAHPQGTARMGEDPRRAVVDSRGRVHSLAQLSVVDASVFPTSASSHTMIPIMAFADLASRAIV